MLFTVGLTAVLGASSDVCDECPADMITAPSDHPCGFECIETVYNCDACPDGMTTVPADNTCGFDCLDYDSEHIKMIKAKNPRCASKWWKFWECFMPKFEVLDDEGNVVSTHGGRRRLMSADLGRRPEDQLATSSRRRLMAWPGSSGSSWTNGGNFGNSWTNNNPFGSASGWNTGSHASEGFQNNFANGATQSGTRGSWAQDSGSQFKNANGWGKQDSHSSGFGEKKVHHDPTTGASSWSSNWGNKWGSSHSWGTHGRRLEAPEELLAPGLEIENSSTF